MSQQNNLINFELFGLCTSAFLWNIAYVGVKSDLELYIHEFYEWYNLVFSRSSVLPFCSLLQVIYIQYINYRMFKGQTILFYCFSWRCGVQRSFDPFWVEGATIIHPCSNWYNPSQWWIIYTINNYTNEYQMMGGLKTKFKIFAVNI